jgi:hypothetical protein
MWWKVGVWRLKGADLQGKIKNWGIFWNVKERRDGKKIFWITIFEVLFQKTCHCRNRENWHEPGLYIVKHKQIWNKAFINMKLKVYNSLEQCSRL